jgi:trans-aconitate methyltransferase
MKGASTHRRDWEELAQLDPLWAVASAPETRFGQTDADAFYSGGAAKVRSLLRRLEALGIPDRHDTALDFGCGAGRLTLPLAGRFGHVTGLDIAPSMLALAGTREPHRDNVEWLLDERGDQAPLAGRAFDLIYSGLVFQHLPSAPFALACLGRLCAAVGPGGALVAQLPTWLPVRSRLHLNQRAYDALRRLRIPPAAIYRRARLHPMRMTAVPRAAVEATVRDAGLEVMRADERRHAALRSLTVYAVRPA